jgi:hypothetical protein
MCGVWVGKAPGGGGQGARPALVSRRGREAEGTRRAGIRAERGADGDGAVGLQAVAVVAGGAIVADELVEQVEGGGDGLF